MGNIRAPRITSRQSKIMVKFLEDNSCMLKKRDEDGNMLDLDRDKNKKLWALLTVRLNRAAGNVGKVSHDASDWEKTLKNLRYKARAKLRAIDKGDLVAQLTMVEYKLMKLFDNYEAPPGMVQEFDEIYSDDEDKRIKLSSTPRMVAKRARPQSPAVKEEDSGDDVVSQIFEELEEIDPETPPSKHSRIDHEDEDIRNEFHENSLTIEPAAVDSGISRELARLANAKEAEVREMKFATNALRSIASAILTLAKSVNAVAKANANGSS